MTNFVYLPSTSGIQVCWKWLADQIPQQGPRPEERLIWSIGRIPGALEAYRAGVPPYSVSCGTMHADCYFDSVHSRYRTWAGGPLPSLHSRGREREKDRLREADSDHTHFTPSPASLLRKTVQHLSEGRGEWAYSREKIEQKERNAGHKKDEKPWRLKQGYVKNWRSFSKESLRVTIMRQVQ